MQVINEYFYLLLLSKLVKYQLAKQNFLIMLITYSIRIFILLVLMFKKTVHLNRLLN